MLVNGFSNSNTVNNSDVPQFVVPDTAARRGGLGGTARQTRLGFFLTQPGVLGGAFSGEVDVDFYGTYNINRYVGAQIGYRSLDLGYTDRTFVGDLQLKGIYFGLVARY